MSARKPGEEIKTKHKEAMRQLFRLAKIGLQQLRGYYDLGDSTIRKILQYDVPERARATWTDRAREFLNAQEVGDVIESVSKDLATRVLNWVQIHDELKLSCSTRTLTRRCKEAGYYSYICCEKSYLIKVQANARWLWGIKYIFWTI
jgi:glycerol-3-phosphate O-acyltransferase